MELVGASKVRQLEAEFGISVGAEIGHVWQAMIHHRGPERNIEEIISDIKIGIRNLLVSNLSSTLCALCGKNQPG
ncbi:MAG: hypothetical protein DMF68_02955 [Acidobacteria bacterium]|nr:MAG: hypothetical protein DMF68_02955 [Acidobacteriota bacterium]